MAKVYLVGTSWYSADQGDMPNRSEFPCFVFVDDFESADAKYQDIAKNDKSWGFGSETAYLVEMEPGVKGHKNLRGIKI